MWLPNSTGIEFLSRAHPLHPHARGVVLLDWSRRTGGDVLVRAGILGQVDDWITKPWQPGDEHFHQAVSAFLYEWARTNQPVLEWVRIVGEQRSARSYELRDLLSRSNVPFSFYPPDSPAAELLLREAGVDASRLPLVITYDGRVLVDPSVAQIAEALGVQSRPDPTVDTTCSSWGRTGRCCRSSACRIGGPPDHGDRTGGRGGQAAGSSLIRNYPGFPRGISGVELTARAFQQAGSFGAAFLFANATGIRADGIERIVAMTNGGEIRARSVLVATAVSYRRLGALGLERLVGRGVFYGAAVSEARAMTGQHVFVVGGAKLGRAGGDAPESVRRAGHDAGPRVHARGDHVGLPHPADRRCDQHRCPLSKRSRRRIRGTSD